VKSVDSPAGRTQLARLVQAAFGRQRPNMAVTRLRGASKKGVYRATLADASTVIVYVWDDAEDFWPASDVEPASDHADPFSHASGLDLFETAQAHLDRLGVRTPHLYLADRRREQHGTDMALVEDITGASLEHLLDNDSPLALPAVEQLSEFIHIMHADTAPRFGKLLSVAQGHVSSGGSCAQVVLNRALGDLAEASARDQRIGQHRNQLHEILHRHAAAVVPRAGYSLIHGELGPDHVLTDHQGRPVIIDIEGLMYFDVEWEHVFLQLRFGQHYPLLHPGQLDPHRVALYQLAMHLSLVAGPLRLLDGDYPEPDGMLEIAEYNLWQVLALLEPP
jgi:Phosphotransferase enzyme family